MVGEWGGSHEGDEAELNLDIKHRGREWKAAACGDEMSGRNSVLTPFPAPHTPPGRPRESHTCCNNVATDFIPFTPEALYPQSAPVSEKLTT